MRFLTYYASRDLVPLYGVYALLFQEHGLSIDQVSSLFVIWSLCSFLFEVPSGAWADTVDRRLLLVLSAAVYAAAFATWLLVPSYAGFATGFALWGLSSALMSGTFEALMYDALAARGAAGDYTRLIGWCHSAAMTASLVAIVSAAPVTALGGFELVGWVSIAIALGQAGLAASLPTTRSPAVAATMGGTAASMLAATESVGERYLSMLRAGVTEAGRSVAVRRAVLVSSLLVGLTAYDEFFPLVARDRGAAPATVPLLVGLVVGGQVVGTALAGRSTGLRPRTVSLLVAVGGGAISAGVLLGPWPGFVVVAVGYGLLNNAMLVSEARLQQVITGPARATVTSVAGLTTEVVALSVYALFAGGGRLASVSTLVVLMALPVAVIAVAARWLPPSDTGPAAEPD